MIVVICVTVALAWMIATSARHGDFKRRALLLKQFAISIMVTLAIATTVVIAAELLIRRSSGRSIALAGAAALAATIVVTATWLQPLRMAFMVGVMTTLIMVIAVVSTDLRADVLVGLTVVALTCAAAFAWHQPVFGGALIGLIALGVPALATRSPAARSPSMALVESVALIGGLLFELSVLRARRAEQQPDDHITPRVGRWTHRIGKWPDAA